MCRPTKLVCLRTSIIWLAEIMGIPYVQGLPHEQPIDLIDCGSFIAIEQSDISGQEDFQHCILMQKHEIDNFVLRLQAMNK